MFCLNKWTNFMHENWKDVIGFDIKLMVNSNAVDYFSKSWGACNMTDSIQNLVFHYRCQTRVHCICTIKRWYIESHSSSNYISDIYWWFSKNSRRHWRRCICPTNNSSMKLVFCYQNCSDLLWEKIVWVIEEKVLKFEAEAENFQKFWDH